MAALALAIAPAPSQAQNENAGTVAFPFLTMNYDARSMAMSGAAAAVQNDIYGVLANPAALGYTNRMQIMAGYRQVMMDVWGCPLGISFPTANGVFAPYLVSLTSGDFNVIDDGGIATGERARSSYTALGLAWAKTLHDNNLAVGAALKGAYHYVGAGTDNFSAFGAALDLGVQYRQNNGRLTYGATLRNVGAMYGYWNEWNEYEMPYGFEAGVSFVPRHMPNLRIALDVNRYNGDFTNFEPAFEYTAIAKTLFIRGGYAFSIMDFEKMLDVLSGERDESYQKSTVNTLSFGVGFNTTMDDVDIKLDAAMQFYTDISSPAVIVSVIVAF
ncbi:MAG: PorV/PorQ family protein [Chitinispirillales bacterium]|nr:PorV/PorQ family protein [Chitinispirillales bacterium]